MREILFKAKKTIDGEWIEGYMYRLSEEHHPFIMLKDRFGEGYEVDESTVCQYTGLTDKNGCKIWEGDVCDRHEKYPEIVKYRQGDYVLDYSYAFGKDSGFNYCNLGFYVCERGCVEVIGNIFDNPELLEAGEANE